MDPWTIYWLILSLLMVLTQSFYSMMEMACVSFNKVRLQYYVSKGDKRAKLIHHLLKHPSYLFGTTLIGVNVAMMIGSECSRGWYQSMGLSPDLAPLTQVLIVVIFGELAPMFAARRYAENMSMLGIRVIWASSKLMTPFIWALKQITSFVELLVGRKTPKGGIFLSKDELQKLFEDAPETSSGSDEFNHIVANIFGLRSKRAGQVMTPLSQVAMIPSNCTVGHMRKILLQTPYPILPIYNKSASNIVGIAGARELLRAPDNKRVRDFADQPWFVTEKTGANQILKQFRRNNQSMAIVLNDAGRSIGILTLDDLLDEVFAKNPNEEETDRVLARKHLFLMERSFPGEKLIEEFNTEHDVPIDPKDCKTLAELFVKITDHPPEKGEKIYLAPYELEVVESSLLEIKKITIRTRI